MTIYEIDAAMTALVDEETGELLDFEQFAALQMERDTKVENMALWYKNLVSDAAAIAEEVKNLNARKTVIANKAERLKKYLDEILCGEKFSTPRTAITFRRSTKTDITDFAALKAWANETGNNVLKYAEPEADRTAIKKLITDGVTVPGASLVDNLSMTIK